MKLLILTAVKSYEKQAVQLFRKAEIMAFSNADINGFKTLDNENLIDNWFSNSSENVRSILFFSFSEERKIDKLLEELAVLNTEIKSDNPLRAIVLNIEKHQ
ncbi:hypothetical protein QWY87_16360 [Lutimonas halocynthiae]|uniref:hypothetical protein n=1 Tax=Lutimonas halocynthiae TaxID=1446477 RepID=UPI0025B5E501|nr:hypothetical protein [Lutimonas halocynthiae]MDN3644289.1 hypothetical protein [Lutimonas halocynthiae]